MQKLKFEFRCDQPESALTIVDGKDYCTLCSTVVLDLREKSDEEVRQIIMQHGGTVCARLCSDQFSIAKRKNNFANKIAVAATAALLLLSTEKSSAQVADSVQTVQTDSLSRLNEQPASLAINTNDSSSSTTSAIQPTAPVKAIRKRVFLTIGRRQFYVVNKFPFIGTRKIRFMGKFKF